ncbi:MAG: peroxidase-related enzyme [Candidatus Acidiferrales bacterium]
MKPMHLPGVEANPQPSPYADLIHNAQKSGGEYWKIWHLFAFQPEMTAHLANFTHSAMHDPAPIEPKLRELIAAYTSRLNDCEFCMKSHTAIAGELYGDEDFVRAVLADPESSTLTAKEKALLRFVAKVTLALRSVNAADSQHLRDLGWTDDAIFYTITVCALFNFYNRWITASGVPAVSEQGHRSRAKLVAHHGYRK